MSPLIPVRPQRLSIYLGQQCEDTESPLTILEKLWQATGGLDDLEVEDLCVRLFDLSLLSALDLKRRVLRLPAP
jgi:hypothetical protein